MISCREKLTVLSQGKPSLVSKDGLQDAKCQDARSAIPRIEIQSHAPACGIVCLDDVGGLVSVLATEIEEEAFELQNVDLLYERLRIYDARELAWLARCDFGGLAHIEAGRGTSPIW